MDSFEELERHQIQTIPDALVQRQENLDVVHQSSEDERLDSVTQTIEPASSSAPSSWQNAESTGLVTLQGRRELLASDLCLQTLRYHIWKSN